MTGKINQSDLNKLRKAFTGKILLPEDPSYEDSRSIFNSDMAPYTTGNPYLNLVADEGKERMIAGYGGEEKYRRLVKIKNQYDPDNIFHLNHNIKP